jgi:quinol monooxygenase YgiN
MSATQVPVTVIARVKVRAGREAEAEAAFRRHVEHVRREEPGTLVYLFHRSRKDPTLFLFYERYADAPAFDRHGKSAAMQSLFRELTPLLDGAPVIELCDELDGKRKRATRSVN